VDCLRYPVKTPVAPDETLTIGWVGSHSTASYLSHIEPALRRVAAAHGDRVQFRFFGQPDYALDVPKFRSLPFRLDHELDALHSLDIGLMPLLDTEWTRGKCAFKAIQYMASGVPTVASPVGITPELIQHDVNGLLASSVDEWFNALDRLIRDANLRQRLALAARQTVEAHYSLEKWGPRVVSLFDQLGRQERILQIETSAA
jgi:glycosyltransferase involved in cell wall biosynthesis